MKTTLLITIMAICNIGYGQTENSRFHGHQNLIGGIWKSAPNASWEDGTSFTSHIVYEESLSGKIIKTKTMGNISTSTNEFGLRNEGIISYQINENKLMFYEFDIFENLTSGVLKYQDKDILYIYKYPMFAEDLTLTDYWEYVDNDTYNFTVGIYDEPNKVWKKTFLKTQFKRSKN